MNDRTLIVNEDDIEKTDADQPRLPCLVVLKGPNMGKVFRLELETVTIGRGEESRISIPDDTVSRVHAEIQLKGDRYIVMDQGSTNGTFVNGKRLSRAALQDGDKIRFGSVLTKFSFHDSLEMDVQEDLHSMAMQDSLTRIFNRRYFLHTLEREVTFAKRADAPLSLILIDVDRFKKVNDNFGHDAGDHTLWAICNEISLIVRAYDTFARVGGEEFGLLLRGVAMSDAVKLAERIRKMIEDLPVTFNGKVLKVTLSLGVIELAELLKRKVKNPETMFLQIADRRLYKAKAQGRNRVVSEGEETL